MKGKNKTLIHFSWFITKQKDLNNFHTHFIEFL